MIPRSSLGSAKLRVSCRLRLGVESRPFRGFLPRPRARRVEEVREWFESSPALPAGRLVDPVAWGVDAIVGAAQV